MQEPLRFTQYVHLRSKLGLIDFPPCRKRHLPELSRRLGFRTARRLRSFDHPQAFDDADLPDAFVLKPDRLWGRKGVMLLRRVPGSRIFFDLLARRLWTVEQIRAEQMIWHAAVMARQPDGYQLFAEELLVGENGEGQVPFDYKLYTFDGEVLFIVQIDRNSTPPRIAFFSNEFKPFDAARCMEPGLNDCAPGEPRVPDGYSDIVIMAKHISRGLGTPFISIDAYATPEGPVVGELTPAPGGPYDGMWCFTPEYDTELGRAWARANSRLGLPEPQYPAGEMTPKEVIAARQAAQQQERKQQEKGTMPSAPHRTFRNLLRFFAKRPMKP